MPLIPADLMCFSYVCEGSSVAAPAAFYPEIPRTATSVLQSPFTLESDNTDHESRSVQQPPELLEIIFFFILSHTDIAIFHNTELGHFKQLIYFLEESAWFVAVIMCILVECCISTEVCYCSLSFFLSVTVSIL